MDQNIIIDGLKFMVLGMVTVYLFLALMILVLRIEHKLVTKFFPNKANSPTPQPAPIKPQIVSSDNDLALVAAITAAIQHHKNQNG
ncbi:OadG family protein [Sulfurospirillum sp. 1612]|uniref:OadG family protein n=1 Tax=Sulfurospirillum sp. 1612 TaxID=3094835 RepID=UPI002F947CE7